MSNQSTDPSPVNATTGAQPVTNPNTANAPLATAVRSSYPVNTTIPSSPTPLTPVRAAVPSAPNSRVAGRGK